MIADVPLGAFLSGGPTREAVVAMMARRDGSGQDLSTAFRPRNTTKPAMRMVARRYGTEREEFVVEPDAVAVLPQLVWHYEPFADRRRSRPGTCHNWRGATSRSR